jgi:menaquinone-dependent protoporphyrinogen oxidase
MHVLVAYATKHGATQGIAARIGATLDAAGLDADVRDAADVDDVSGYDAFVIGSAAYIGHWRKEALELARRLEPEIAGRPVWLYSSGPLGDSPTDAEGHDQRESAEPRDLPDLMSQLQPRDHRVFFGALDPGSLTLPEKAMRTLPAGKQLLPEGDFRDWEDIEAWATGIASELASPSPGSGD